MSDKDEKQHVFTVGVNIDRFMFAPTVAQYELIRETNSYYFVMERGNEVKIHKSSSRQKCFRTIEAVREHIKEEKQRVIERLEKRLADVKDRTTLSINEIDPEPFTLDENIRV